MSTAINRSQITVLADIRQPVTQARPVARPPVAGIFGRLLGGLALGVLLQITVLVAAPLMGVTSKSTTLMLALGALQLGMVAAILGGSRSKGATLAQRLGLTKARIGWRGGLLLAGSAPALWLGMIGLLFAAGGPSKSMIDAGKEFSSLSLWLAIPLIALLPGICEELVFRGFAQRRLASRWGPVAGIILTSAMFGLYHVDPKWMMIAMTMGLWFGVVAWRTGATWPAMIGHIANNATPTLLVSLTGTAGSEAEPMQALALLFSEIPVLLTFGASILCLASAILMLARLGKAGPESLG